MRDDIHRFGTGVIHNVLEKICLQWK